jgi:putative spermidine/putrescine transport system permease protein
MTARRSGERRGRSGMTVGVFAYQAYIVAVCVFLLAPIVVAVVLSFSSVSQLRFPPPGLSLQWYRKAASTPEFISGFGVSVAVAACVSALSTTAGTLAAVAINHYRFWGRTAMQTFVMLPLVLPTVVIGLGVLQALGWYGIRTGFLAVVLGHSVIGLPYVTYLVLAALVNYDLSLEHASLNLGATRLETFRRVTLPLLRPGITAGAVFVFLLSFDNVALSLFLTRGDTLPLRLMQHIQYYADPSVAAVSSVLLLFSLMVLFAVGHLLRQREDLRLVA